MKERQVLLPIKYKRVEDHMTHVTRARAINLTITSLLPAHVTPSCYYLFIPGYRDVIVLLFIPGCRDVIVLLLIDAEVP